MWYLNAADKEGEFAYMRVVEILRRYILICWTRCMGSRQLENGDTALRWNLLYVLVMPATQVPRNSWCAQR